jgi:hypothetical protein
MTTIGNAPQTISIDDVEYIRADSIPTPVTPGDGLSPLVGCKVFIRTVTMHYTGRIVALTESVIVLADAAWIADSGRFHDALRTGKLSEVEPFLNSVYVARGALVDVTMWDHDLPRTQK